MKNTQKWLLIVFTALTLAVVSTAVLAAGLPQETGSAALPKTTPERRTDIPMRTTDLSLFRLEKGSRALQIMKEGAACKKIRASEIEYYNLLPEEIKQLTHKEACARYEQLCRMGYDDIYNADISANEKNELLEKRNNLNSHLYFYIRLTAVGKDYLANRFEAVEGVAKGWQTEYGYNQDDEPEYPENNPIGKRCLYTADFILELTKQAKQELEQSGDTEYALYKLDCLEGYMLSLMERVFLPDDDPFSETDALRAQLDGGKSIPEVFGQYADRRYREY